MMSLPLYLQVVHQFPVRLTEPYPLGGVDRTGVQHREGHLNAGVTWLQRHNSDSQTGESSSDRDTVVATVTMLQLEE